MDYHKKYLIYKFKYLYARNLLFQFGGNEDVSLLDLPIELFDKIVQELDIDSITSLIRAYKGDKDQFLVRLEYIFKEEVFSYDELVKVLSKSDPEYVITFKDGGVFTYEDYKNLLKKHIRTVVDVHSMDYINELTSLQTLKFYHDFNQPIDALSNLTSLQTLKFGNRFNQSIDALSNLTSLQTLTLGINFNQPIDALSNLTSLQTLEFHKFSTFDQSIDALRNLKSIRTLKFGWKFNKPIDALSDLTSLQTLIFEGIFNQRIDVLSNLTSLQTLKFGFGFNQRIDALSNLTSLQKLTLGINFNQPINVLRELTSLRELHITSLHTYRALRGVDIPKGLKVEFTPSD